LGQYLDPTQIGGGSYFEKISGSGPGSQSDAIPADLAGSWGYSSDPDSRVFTINSDGSGTYGNNACTWSVSGSTLTLTMTLQGQTMTGSAAYSISSGRLTFSNQSGLLGQYLDPTQIGGGSYFEKISGSGPNPDPGPEKGVYIGLLSFAGSATELIGNSSSQVPYLDYGRSSMSFSYNRASQSGTALYYAIHKALANLKEAESSFPAGDIQSVYLITFTDGLDNGSFGASNANPIDGKSGVASADYATYVKAQIASRTIGGKPINAYSIGVMGSDISDVDEFNTTLSDIASTQENVHTLSDFSDLQTTLTEIADSIEVNVETKADFAMTATLNDPGTTIRVTFDVTGSTPADMAASTRYIEGTLTYNSNSRVYSLTNITYSPGIASDSGTSITGTLSGNEVSFKFENITGYDPRTEYGRVKQWTKSPGSTVWNYNSEYQASASTNTTIDVDTVLVYLVLDASTSLSSEQVSTIRSAVNQFINTLYRRTHPYY
jgi:hypothetical protein